MVQEYLWIAHLQALDAFLLFFGEDTFQRLSEQTNLYASQLPPGSSYKWHETTPEEMQFFLGMILAMGIHQLQGRNTRMLAS